MAYNYRNKTDYKTGASLSFDITAPQLSDGEAKIKIYTIDDSCSWFDEWRNDRVKLGITDDRFSWSPDDGCPLWSDEDARAVFLSLEDKYSDCCRLEPEVTSATVSGGRLTVKTKLGPNAAAFIEIRGAV